VWTVFVFIKSDFEVQVDDRSATCHRRWESSRPMPRYYGKLFMILPEASVRDRTS
jgi:hypothetical protein